MRPFAFFLFVIALSSIRAAEAETSWHVTGNVYSLHEHTTRVYLHNTTPGLGVMHRRRDWLEGAGVFRNSLGRWAGMGYFGWQKPLGPIRAGAIVGLTHNYDANNRGIVPLGAGVVTIPVTQNFALDLVFIPHISNATYTTLNFSFSWRIR